MVARTSGAGRFIISLLSILSNVAHCRTLAPGLCFYRDSFYEQTLTDGQRPRSLGGSTPAIGEGPQRQPERATLTSRKCSPLPRAKVQKVQRRRLVRRRWNRLLADRLFAALFLSRHPLAFGNLV
jgi:hypothetical protein